MFPQKESTMFQNKIKRQEQRLAQAVASLEPDYLSFTASKLRSTASRQEDLRKLILHPHITKIAFARACLDNRAASIGRVHWLLLATTHVTIKHGLRRYAIGEFIIYLARHNSDGESRPAALIENITRTNPLTGGPQEKRYGLQDSAWYAHPHASGLLAQFCIDENQAISEALLEGNMCEAFAILDAALHSYGPHTPFCDIECWPTLTWRMR